MDYREKIIQYLTSQAYIPVKAYTLFDLLSDEEDGTAPFREEEFEQFSDALNELIEEGSVVLSKKNKLLPTESAAFIKGTFRGTARGHFGFVVPEEGLRDRYPEDLFISAEDAGDAINGDLVLAVLKEKKGARHTLSDSRNPDGKILRVLAHTVETLSGVLTKESNYRRGGRTQYYVTPDDSKLNFLIHVHAEELQGALVGDKVEVKIDIYPENGRATAKGHITKVFGDSQSGSANYAALLSHHDVKTEFDDDTLKEADKRAAEEPLLTADRLDLRDRIVFTIDSADAKDLDDAISIERNEEGYLLGVHIADVSHYVRPSSALDREAFQRGTSIYFIDQVVPMLPKALSNGICSLNGGVDRYALSALIQLSKEGELMSCQLHESLIRSKVRGVYTEVNDLIEKREDSEFYEKYKILYPDTLPTMVELYEILERRSRERGALELETSEAKIILDENGDPVDIVKRERGVAEKLIEQFMLAANEGVASFLAWQDMPCVYRIHETPTPEKIRTFRIFAHNAGLDTASLSAKTVYPTAYQNILQQAEQAGIASIVSYVMLRSLMKAKYSASLSPHFGLAMDRYCHFTSPIRRYPDLAVHRIVKEILHGTLTQGRIAELERFAIDAAEASTENEIKATAAERDIEDLYRILYMQGQVGQEFEGIISSVTSFGFFVELENTCEGLVHISSLKGHYDYHEASFTLSCGLNVFHLGDRVRVRLEKADITSRKLDMTYLGRADSPDIAAPSHRPARQDSIPANQSRNATGKKAAPVDAKGGKKVTAPTSQKSGRAKPTKSGSHRHGTRGTKKGGRRDGR